MTGRVLLLFAATPDPGAALTAAGFGDRIAFDVITSSAPRTPVPGAGTVIALTRGPAPAADRVLRGIGAITLRDRLATFPAGRLLNSMGPADPAKVFWRALRAHPEAVALATPQTFVIAGDLAATRAARGLLDRGRAARAIWGLRAGLDELAR